ncbi:hypothetical protein [Halorhabdus rudnickae]|uniref:hypothetical protein n=1 Tax=Halorhabdus rudnickae TaxID=1775544 RepID=UPI001AEF6430|nr:hypothetical protein [Halorhabdus rudnickae]
MYVEKIGRVAIDRRPLVVNLDVTRSEIGMVGVPVESEHKISLGFDPVQTIEGIVDVAGIPESYFQPCGPGIVGIAEEHRRLDVGKYVTRSSPRWAISNALTAGMFRKPVVDPPE